MACQVHHRKDMFSGQERNISLVGIALEKPLEHFSNFGVVLDQPPVDLSVLYDFELVQ
jgi:hypothetical protein